MIDALVGLTLVTILSTAFLGSIMQANKVNGIARDKLAASLAGLEVYEVGVHLAQSDFSALQADLFTCSTGCHFSTDGTTWSIQANSEFVFAGRFERVFTLESVHRSNPGGEGDIVSTGGYLDTRTIALTTTVSWSTKGDTFSETITTYLHDI